MACGPDVIFIGGWLAGSYDALSQIAPVVYLATDSDLGVVESVRQNTRAIASLFGLEDTAGELMTGFDSRVAALTSFSEGRTAIVWAWLPAAASMCWATASAAASAPILGGKPCINMISVTSVSTFPPAVAWWKQCGASASTWIRASAWRWWGNPAAANP